MRRRTYLIGLATTTTIAGCTGDEEDDDAGEPEPEETNDSEGEPDDNSSENDDLEGADDVEEDNAGEDGEESEFVDGAGEQIQLAYGERAEMSNGVWVTIHGIEEVSTEIAGEQPDELEAFAVVHVEAANEGDAEARLPDPVGPDFELLYEDQQVGTAFRSRIFSETDYEEYEGHDVQPGVRREGHMLFEVSNPNLEQSDIDVLFQQSLPAEDLDGEVDVRWTDG